MVKMNKLIDLVNKRTKIELWANEYLDKNSELMDDVYSTHDVFKEYNKKMDEYHKIVEEIRNIEHGYNR